MSFKPESFGFKKNDYHRKIFILDGVILGRQSSNIKEILKFLKKTYCGPVGYEYMHIWESYREKILD